MKLSDYLPIIDWLGAYKRRDLSGDLSAGLTVAVMLVPQGMAYAMLAGLPPVVGLYASTLPLIAYALFGTSRQLAVGPVAIVSLLVAVAAAKAAPAGSAQYIAVTVVIAFMAGAAQLLLGLLRAGFLVNFLSHAVISGFSSAAAIVIGLSQLKHLLGISLSGQTHIFKLPAAVAEKAGDIVPAVVVIGVAAIGLLAAARKLAPRFPAPLVVVGVGTAVVYFFRLHEAGVPIVGDVPGGFPSPVFPEMDWKMMGQLVPTALTIVFVGFMESVAVAQTIAAREKYKIDANKEFIGLGVANIVSGVFSGYPVTGGFSRTAVNHQAGAKTPLASIITAVIIILTLFFLTPLFYYLPQAVLAAIIMVAVYGLIDFKTMMHLFKMKKADGWTFVLTFVGTLVLGIEEGIVVGVVFSLLVFIWRSSHPHIAELGYLEREGWFSNIKRYPEARTFPHIMILRVDAALYFANMAFIEKDLRSRLVDRPDIHHVIFDLSSVNDIDAPAFHVLTEMEAEYRALGIAFHFSRMKGPIRDIFQRSDWKPNQLPVVEYQPLPKVLARLGVEI